MKLKAFSLFGKKEITEFLAIRSFPLFNFFEAIVFFFGLFLGVNVLLFSIFIAFLLYFSNFCNFISSIKLFLI